MRYINIKVSEDFLTITPEKRQDAGIMGEKGAVEVVYELTSTYLGYHKRVEFVDATGKLFTTDEAAYNELLINRADNKYSIQLPGEWTLYGGIAHIRMVVYLTDSDGNETERLKTPQLPLLFESSREGNDKAERRSLSELIVGTHQVKELAITATGNATLAADAANLAAEKAKDAAAEAYDASNAANAAAQEIQERAENGEFDGAQGPVGATPKLTFGNITMLPSNYTPTAAITGTAENPVLNLAIPRGEDGADGYAITNVKIIDGHLWVYIYNGTEVEGVDAGELPVGSAEGTSEYPDLNNMPQINGVELSGDKTAADLKLKQVYVQSEEPTDAPEGAVWIDPEEETGDVVTSVNGKTGEVKLTARDVGALPEGTVIPESYTLPIATADTLGGVKPVAKTEDMTQEVGVDETGALFTTPGSGTSGCDFYTEISVEEDVASYTVPDLDPTEYGLFSIRTLLSAANTVTLDLHQLNGTACRVAGVQIADHGNNLALVNNGWPYVFSLYMAGSNATAVKGRYTSATYSSSGNPRMVLSGTIPAGSSFQIAGWKKK